MVDAFSSEQARQTSLAGVALRVAARDADAALDLLETWVTDPDLRRSTQEQIVAGPTQPQPPFPPGIMPGILLR